MYWIFGTTEEGTTEEIARIEAWREAILEKSIEEKRYFVSKYELIIPKQQRFDSLMNDFICDE